MPCILSHADEGVFLGAAMGFAFWSNNTPSMAGQAAVFDSENDAREFVASWTQGLDMKTKLAYTYVSEEDLAKFGGATPALCKQPGLPEWDPDAADDETDEPECDCIFCSPKQPPTIH